MKLILNPLSHFPSSIIITNFLNKSFKKTALPICYSVPLNSSRYKDGRGLGANETKK